MKKITLLLLMLCCYVTIHAQCTDYVNIPDANFKAALIANTSINTDRDAEISCTEASAYTGTISLGSSSNVSELTGIEAFVNLTVLFIQNQNLTSLNLSANTKLRELRCNHNKLTSIDVSNNSVLETLDCSNNELTSLDVSDNIGLENLFCSFNKLTLLDLSTNLELSFLNCSENELQNLNTSTNRSLIALFCLSNELTSIDLPDNSVLETFDCRDNHLTSLDLSDNLELRYVTCSENKLESLDISNNKMLEYIYCNDNELTSLNAANGNNENLIYSSEAGTDYGFNAIGNPNLTCIQVDDVAFSDEYWENKDSEASFSTDCSTSSCIVNIPDANFKAALIANTLINSDGDDKISCEEAEAYTGSVRVLRSSISDLTGIEAFTNITGLYCNNNDLTNLDISNNIALEYLNCDHNPLTSLNVSTNTALYYLSCRGNALTSLDVSNNISLTTLRCTSNSLTDLDTSNNIALEDLYCYNNNLISLNIANGNNINMYDFIAINNPDLTCIQVDDVAYSTDYWTTAIDDTSSFSVNCNSNNLEQKSVFYNEKDTTINTINNLFNNDISIYPNPFVGSINLELKTEDTIKEVQIYNLQGKEIINTNKTIINTNALTTGIYLLKASTIEGGIVTKKLMKK